MSTAPNPNAAPVRRRKRVDEPKSSNGIPLVMKILAVLCVALVILVPVAARRGWFRHNKAAETVVEQNVIVKNDLLISESSYNRAARTVKGTVVNNSNTPYTDVQVSYEVWGSGGNGIEVISANISRLGPHQSAPFETNPMGAPGLEYHLREVVGRAQ